MVRRRFHEQARPRPARHGRHGRQGRSPVVRPPLPPLQSRWERFDLIVGTAAEFLQSAWADLREVSFEIADMPQGPGDDGIPRWSVDRDAKKIVLYRLPIERLDGMARLDPVQQRMVMEGCVFRAAGEYVGRDPWELGTEHFRF